MPMVMGTGSGVGGSGYYSEQVTVYGLDEVRIGVQEWSKQMRVQN